MKCNDAEWNGQLFPIDRTKKIRRNYPRAQTRILFSWPGSRRALQISCMKFWVRRDFRIWWYSTTTRRKQWSIGVRRDRHYSSALTRWRRKFKCMRAFGTSPLFLVLRERCGTTNEEGDGILLTKWRTSWIEFVLHALIIGLRKEDSPGEN